MVPSESSRSRVILASCVHEVSHHVRVLPTPYLYMRVCEPQNGGRFKASTRVRRCGKRSLW